MTDKKLLSGLYSYAPYYITLWSNFYCASYNKTNTYLHYLRMNYNFARVT